MQSYEGAINTAIVKVFELTIGSAGLSARQLRKAGTEFYTSTTYSGSHATYYPGAESMTIQLVFAPDSGRLYGAQVVGQKGVDKRLDLLASVIKRNGTVYELTEIEHAYAPPFSSAKDPVNIAGFTAENILHNRMRTFHWNEVAGVQQESFILDVRSADEFMAGSIDGAVNIPLDQLRSRLHELPANSRIYVYCQIGLRGYLATRILLQRGFPDVFNLSGGYRLWHASTREQEKIQSKKALLSVL